MPTTISSSDGTPMPSPSPRLAAALSSLLPALPELPAVVAWVVAAVLEVVVVGMRDVVQEGDAKDEMAGSMADADECVAAAVWSSAETLVGAMDALRRLVMIQAGRSSVNRYSLSSQQEPDCAAFWPVGRRLTSAV